MKGHYAQVIQSSKTVGLATAAFYSLEDEARLTENSLESHMCSVALFLTLCTQSTSASDSPACPSMTHHPWNYQISPEDCLEITIQFPSVQYCVPCKLLKWGMVRLDKELLWKVLLYQGIFVFNTIYPRSIMYIRSFITVSVITFY